MEAARAPVRTSMLRSRRKYSGTGEEFQALGGKAIRGIGDADVLGGIDGESLGADGGGDYGDLGRHGFVDFQTGATADAQGHDGDGGVPKIGTDVGDGAGDLDCRVFGGELDRKSTRLNSSHLGISYAVFCL